jgi:hypothetical protein
MSINDAKKHPKKWVIWVFCYTLCFFIFLVLALDFFGYFQIFKDVPYLRVILGVLTLLNLLMGVNALSKIK